MVVTAKVIIETPWGILLVKDNVDYKKRYSLPGGNFDSNKENKYWQAAVREVFEELKLEVVRGNIQCIFEDIPGTPVGRQKRSIYIYVAQVKNPARFPKLAQGNFSSEVNGIAFLDGSVTLAGSQLQGHVKYVLKNYVTNPLLRNNFKKYFSDINIDSGLTAGWKKKFSK